MKADAYMIRHSQSHARYINKILSRRLFLTMSVNASSVHRCNIFIHIATDLCDQFQNSIRMKIKYLLFEA